MKLKYVLIFILCAVFCRTAHAHNYSEIKNALWSEDDSKFILLYDKGDNGECDRLELYDTSNGKLLKSYEAANDGASWLKYGSKEIELKNKDGTYKNLSYAQITKFIQKWLNEIKGTDKFVSAGWIASDPHSMEWLHNLYQKAMPYPGSGTYHAKIFLQGKDVQIIFKVKSNFYQKEEDEKRISEYYLFAKRADESEPRLLEQWDLRKDISRWGFSKKDIDSIAYTFILGGISLSPSGRKICVMLRRFDEGFEGPSVDPVPVFFTTEQVLGTQKNKPQ